MLVSYSKTKIMYKKLGYYGGGTPLKCDNFNELVQHITSDIPTDQSRKYDFLCKLTKNIKLAPPDSEYIAFCVMNVTLDKIYYIIFDWQNIAKINNTNNFFEEIWNVFIDNEYHNIVFTTGEFAKFNILISRHNSNLYAHFTPPTNTKNVDKFRKLSTYFVLGSGSQGSVMLGYTSEKLNKKVAIKCVNLSGSLSSYRFVKREINHLKFIINMCANKYLCYIDSYASPVIGTNDIIDPLTFAENMEIPSLDSYYIVTEYYPSMTLSKFISQQTDTTAMFGAFYQILEYIENLHEQNIIHNDIKSDNVLILKSTQNLPIIIDFGTSCKNDDQILSECLSHPGTPIFAAPTKIILKKMKTLLKDDELLFEELIVISKLNDIWGFFMMVLYPFCDDIFDIFPAPFNYNGSNIIDLLDLFVYLILTRNEHIINFFINKCSNFLSKKVYSKRNLILSDKHKIAIASSFMREYKRQIHLLVEFSEYLSCSNTQVCVNKPTADVYFWEIDERKITDKNDFVAKIKRKFEFAYGDALDRAIKLVIDLTEPD